MSRVPYVGEISADVGLPVSIGIVASVTALTTWWFARSRATNSQQSTVPISTSLDLDPSLPTRHVWRVVPKAGSLQHLQHIIEAQSTAHFNSQRCTATIRLHCIGLNMADIFAIQGLYSATPAGSFIPGLEFSGIVHAVHHGTQCTCSNTPHPYKVGDRICGVTRFGAYSDYVLVDLSCLYPLPPTWSMAQGASFLVTSLTAYYGMFHLARLSRHETCLIHSGAGGVGLVAIDMAHASGAHVITTVGSTHKVEQLVERGVARSRIIVRTHGSEFGCQLDAALRTIPPPDDGESRKLDVVMDSLLGDYYRPAFNRLAPCGRHVIFGAASFSSPTDSPSYLTLIPRFLSHLRNFTDPMSLIATNRTLMGFNLIWLWDKMDALREMITNMTQLLPHDEDGNLKPPVVGQTFQWVEMPQALRFLQSGQSIGKVVVIVRDPS